MPMDVVFRGQYVGCVDSVENVCFSHASASVSCLMTAAAVSLGLHQLLFARSKILLAETAHLTSCFQTDGVELHVHWRSLIKKGASVVVSLYLKAQLDFLNV